jgi:PAS domain S-box-containing protein
VTLASIGDAVIATDPRGRVVFMNPTAEALTLWRQEEAIGVPLEQVFASSASASPSVSSGTLTALRF